MSPPTRRPGTGATPYPLGAQRCAEQRPPGLRTALLTGGVVAAATVVVHLYDPNQPGSYGACPLRLTTGLLCPLCGATRAVHALTHGQWEVAMGFNPAVPLLLPLLVLLWLGWLGRALQGRTTRYAERLSVFAVAVAAVVGFGVLRNLPSLEPYLARLT